MSTLQTIAQLLMQQLGDKGAAAGTSNLLPALEQLLPTQNGDIDLGALIEKFTSNGDLMSLASSWLGDGANSPVSGDQIANVLGESNVSQFAEQLGMQPTEASNALSDVIPQIIDSSSEGGNLLEGSAASLVQGALKNFF